MPRASAFNSTHFSSRPSYQEQIYGEMVKSLGSGRNYSDDFNSLVGARLYAFAMAFGRCKYAIERLGHQFLPSRALENLPLLEREYGIAPDPGATIAERRARVVVEARIARGASRTNVEFVLEALFGDDFLRYVTTDIASTVVSPVDPTTTGVYSRAGTPRGVFRTLGHVTRTNEPTTVSCELVAGNAGTLQVGRRFVVDTADPGRVEATTIEQVAGSGPFTVTATFRHPHTAGVFLGTGRHANQFTSKRENIFVMSPAAALDAIKRRRLHRTARRLLRGISTWCITDGSGPFKVNEGKLGITTIGAVP